MKEKIARITDWVRDIKALVADQETMRDYMDCVSKEGAAAAKVLITMGSEGMELYLRAEEIIQILEHIRAMRYNQLVTYQAEINLIMNGIYEELNIPVAGGGEQREGGDSE